MYTSAPSTLMHALAAREDWVSPRPHDRPVVEALRRTWSRIGRCVKAERPDYPQPRQAYVGLFVLGYGQVPGTQDSAAQLFAKR